MDDDLKIPQSPEEDRTPLKDWPLERLEAARESCILRLTDASKRKAVADALAIGRELNDFDRELALRRVSARLTSWPRRSS